MTATRELFGELKLPFRHSYIDGEIYPAFIKESHLEITRNFKLCSDDVIITTFPKNGTTWTQGIVTKLHEHHNTGHLKCDEKNHLVRIIPWLENTDPEVTTTLPSPRYFKTHNSYRTVVYDPDVPCRYIYVARNPKDVCVSLYHHCRGFKVFDYQGEFEEFVELFLKGHVESGDWWEHVRAYHVNARAMNMLFLKYEDMTAWGPEVIKQINDFCGLPEISLEEARSVEKASSFNAMAKDPSLNHEWSKSRRNEQEQKFMRKGKVGDWKNYFTDEMTRKFDEKTARMFEGLDLTFVDE